MGKFDRLARFLGLKASEYGDDAVKILEKVDTPEFAVSLKGQPRSEYLKALDEVYGPATIRQKLTGHTSDAFHGTADVFDQFSNEKLGSVTGPGTTKKQHWFSTNPEVANVFAEQAGVKKYLESVAPLYDKINADKKDILEMIKKTSDAPKPEAFLNMDTRLLENMKKYGEINQETIDKIVNFRNDKKKLDKIMLMKNELKTNGSNIVQVKLNTEGLKELDANGKNWSDLMNEIGNEEKIVKNIKEGSDYDYVPMGDSIGIKDTSKIRSINAAFDPRFKESSLLMAGGLAGQQLPEVDISPLPFLKKGAEAYESAKEKIIEPLARQINFTNDPEIQKIAESGLGIVADPLNYISGPIGYGTAALQGLSAFIPKKRGLSDMVEEYNTKRGNR